MLTLCPASYPIQINSWLKNLTLRLNSLRVRQWTKVPLKTTAEVMEHLCQGLQMAFHFPSN